jgi:hypothetical protein
MKKYLLTVATVLVAGFLVATPLAGAVEYGGVGGRPANPRADNPRTKSIFVYTSKAGAELSDAVQVINNTDKMRQVTVGAVDSVLSSGGAFSCRQEAEPKEGVGSWIHLSQTQVTVPATDSVTVPFTIRVPQKAGPGEHDGCITIQDASMTTSPSKTNGVVLGFRSGIRVSITIPGKIKKHLSLAGVTVNGPTNGKYMVSSKVQNDGNVSADAQVTASLKPLFGAAGASSTGTYPVLPDSTADLNFEVKRPFWGGLYRGQSVVKYNSDPAVELGATKATNQSVSDVSDYVWVVPAPLAAVIELIILAILVAAIWFVLHRARHKKHVHKHWSEYTVAKSDTVQKLAEKHGISWKRLAAANKLKAPYELQKGQKIKVPPTEKE